MIRNEFRFAAEAEARAFAADFRQRNWGYSPSTSVWQAPDGHWLVAVSMYSSCD